MSAAIRADERAWPLVFTYRGIITGETFMASVDSVSRVLAEQRDDGNFWLDGAEPGGVAAGGDDLSRAHDALKLMFHNILTDLAEEAEDFSAFTDSCKAFLEDADSLVSDEWMRLWMRSRQGKLDCTPVAQLDKRQGRVNPRLDVELFAELEKSTPAPIMRVDVDRQLALAA